MTAYIGYDNFLAYPLAGGYRVPQETAGHEFANAFNSDLFSTWVTGTTANNKLGTIGTPATVNYIGIYGHNIQGLTMSLRSAVGTLAHSFEVAPGTNFVMFEPVTSSTWYLDIFDTTGAEHITLLSIGQATQLNPLRVPFAPPPKAQNVEIINNLSVENIPLGRVTRPVPFPLRIDQTLVAEEWVDANCEGLFNHINSKPFFFMWDDTKDDACVCWTDKPVDAPMYKRYGYQEFSIQAWGLR